MNAKSILLFFITSVLSSVTTAQRIEIITHDVPSELVQVRIMVKAGSAHDPKGLEGLAYFIARMLLEGSYGDPKKPVTKEMLADIVRPWGSKAKPSVRVGMETTTYSFTVPREVFVEYTEKVLKPLFTQPLFAEAEVERIRKETETYIASTVRLEQTELLGLYAIDGFLHEGTRYGHLPAGTIQGVRSIKRSALQRFYKTYYSPANIVVAVSTKDGKVLDLIQKSLEGFGRTISVAALRKQKIEPPAPVKDRRVLIVSQPMAIATGIHAAFPISVNRGDKDFWALYVANVFFGAHRDGFGRLFNEIRQDRGYNYGTYSYIEWFEDRPSYLFPPTNVPRRYQYFSIWVRPVAHEYAHHILKAITWELENFVREGMSPEECELAKNKAKVIYLNLAETSERLLAYKLDDHFYGLPRGFLEEYLEAIDKLTPEQINAAIRKHLQANNLKYVIVTNEEWAHRLKEDIANNKNAKGKDFSAYNIDTTNVGGEIVWQFPKKKIELVQKDKIWESYWLDIPADKITVVSSTQLFENAELVKK